MKRIAVLLMVLLMAVTLAGCAQKAEPRDVYDQAAALLQTDDYAGAAAAFASLGHYMDAPKYVMYCEAALTAEKGDHAAAAASYAALGDFQDSRLLAVYHTARAYEEAEAYEQAMIEYQSIPLYGDASGRAAQMPGKALERDYKAAVRLQENKRYEAALAAFAALNGYSDSAARMTAIREQQAADAAVAEEQRKAEAYAAAVQLETAGELAKAERAFLALGDYQDSAARAKAAAYRGAAAAQEAGDTVTAYEAYTRLGTYEDSAARAAALHDEAMYLSALSEAENGRYTKAQEAFAALGEYRDSAEKARLLGVFAMAQNSKRLGSGLYAFRMDDQWGLVNLNSNRDLAPRWNDMGAFNARGLAIVKGWNSRNYSDAYGLIDEQGQIVLATEYLAIVEGDKGLFTAVENGTGYDYVFTLISAEGKPLSRWKTLGGSNNSNPGSRYNSYTVKGPRFVNGTMIAEGSNGWSLLNADCEEIMRGEGRLSYTSLAAANDAVLVESRWGYQIFGLDGAQKTDRYWSTIGGKSEGLTAVTDSKGLHGFIDSATCQVVIEPQYKNARTFSEGLAAVQTTRGYWGFINKAGEMVIQPVYRDVTDFRNGRSTVRRGEDLSYRVIDAAGTLVYFKEDVYRYAAQLEDNGRFEEAIAEYEALNGYLDSDDRALQAREKINAQIYARAEKMEAAGKLAEAAEAFEWLGEYSDSQDRAANARETIRANAYAAAAALEESGRLEEAINAFAALGDYRGSADHAVEIREGINSGIYQTAADLDEAGRYEEAIAVFATLSDYRDAAERITACEEKICVRDYNAAAALEEAGQYEQAIAAFAAMNGYSDSAERIPVIIEKIVVRDYNAAAMLEEAGQYEQAIRAFAAMSGYGDTAERIAACEEKIRVRDYNAAAMLEEAGQYEQAIRAFAAMNGYSDSAERIAGIQEKIRVRDYNAAAMLEEAGQYEEAITAFAAMNGYSDSAERIAGIQEKILARDYAAAAALEEAGNYSDAYAAFVALGGYSDAAARAEGVVAKAVEEENSKAYAAAEAVEQAGELEQAEAAFAALGDYRDSADRTAAVQDKIRQRDYAAGVTCLDNEEYAAAAAIFEKLGSYADSRERLTQAKTGESYQAAFAAALEGKLTEAYQAFIALGDYKDSARKAEIIGNLSRAGKTQQIAEGILIYEFHELWGIANLNENVIVPVKYTSIRNQAGTQYAANRLLYVYLKGSTDVEARYGYIDYTGREIVPCEYIKVTDFDENGNCTVAKWAGRLSYGWYYHRFLFGIINANGRTITEAKWRTMGDSKNKKWDYYDRYESSQCVANEPKFTDGRMLVQDSMGSWGMIDQNGQILGEVKWGSVGGMSEGMALVSYDSKWGFINEKGQTIGEVRWNDVRKFSNGYAAVKEGSLWGFINKQNELVIPCRYVEVNDFKSDGTCDVKTQDGTWQIINTAGEVSFFGN